MNGISTVGLDLAKQVFEVHAMDGAGQVVLRKTLRRRARVRACTRRWPACAGSWVRIPLPPWALAWVRSCRSAQSFVQDRGMAASSGEYR